jgi:dihydrofolate reductase
MTADAGRRPAIAIVVAIADNGVIGAEGDMPWHLSTDLRRFRQITMGHPVIMGRKTYESIGKPLPGRTNIVVTRQADFAPEGMLVAKSVDEAVSVARTTAMRDGVDAICILGGGQIYRETLPKADILHVTHVECSPEGDTVFPAIEIGQWHAEEMENVPKGERDTCNSRYVVYRRISSAAR